MKAAFFDVDGTLVREGIGVLFIKHLTSKGIFPKEKWNEMVVVLKKYMILKITYQTMQETLIHLWITGIYNIEQKTITNESKIFIESYTDIFPKILEIMQFLKKMQAFFQKVLQVSKGYLKWVMSLRLSDLTTRKLPVVLFFTTIVKSKK